MNIVDLSALSIFLIISMQESKNYIAVEITDNIFFSSQYLLNNHTNIRNKNDLEDLIDNMIKKYANVGFPFCHIYPEVVYKNEAIEKVILKIDEGERVMVTDYIFHTQGKTETSIIRRIADAKTGIYFSHKEVEKSKRNLLRTEVFENIDDNLIYQDGNYYVLLYLTEKKTDYFTVLGSFAEDDFHFSISFHSLNLLGTLRRLQFLYEYEKLFSFQFSEPLLIYPAEIEGNFSLLTYDSVRLIQFSGTVTAPLGRYFEVSLMSGIEAISYYGNIPETQGHTDNTLGLSFAFHHNTSNWALNQTIGYEHLFRQHDRRRVRYDGEFEMLKLNLKTHCYVVNTDSFEYFDYYRLGGAHNLRGYFEEEFIVSDAIWLNCEYKKFFVFPLFDIGLLDNDIKFSYGFGIEAKSDFANATLVIAWPQKANWRDGKIHLMLKTGF